MGAIGGTHRSRAQGGPASIYTWHHNEPIELYRIDLGAPERPTKGPKWWNVPTGYLSPPVFPGEMTIDIPSALVPHAVHRSRFTKAAWFSGMLSSSPSFDARYPHS